MDINSALQIIGVIVEFYATVLSIVFGIYVISWRRLRERGDRRFRALQVIFWIFFGWCFLIIGHSFMSMFVIATSQPHILDLANLVGGTILWSFLGMLVLLTLTVYLMLELAE